MLKLGTGTLAESNSKETIRLRAVLAVGRKVTSILDLDRLLAESARLIQQVFGYELVTLFLRDQHDPNYYFTNHYSGKIAIATNIDSRTPYRKSSINQGMVGWVFRHEQHRLANDVSQDPYYYYFYEDTKAELDLPLKINGQVIGVLDIESTKINAFDPEDIPFLEILADQIAIAIENARLASRAREAAIAEERNRLARDLHDDTVQALIGIGRQLDLLQCDLTDEFTDGKLPAQIERRMERLQNSLDRTIQDLRLLSRELQPQLLRDLGLAAALDALTCDISRTSELKVKIELRDAIKRLTDQQELEVYRVAQEALGNITKHADAKNVHVVLDVKNDTVLLHIKDDGKGFEVPDDLTNLAKRGGMGVLSMRQRACSVGGFLDINSEPGQGTSLTLGVPLTPSAEHQ